MSTQTVTEALRAFPAWMNRPLARVHVYTWKLAILLEPSANAHKCGSIRYVPAHRSDDCLSWRKTVAAAIRIARRGSKIRLPYYDEASGNYVHPNPNADIAPAYPKGRWTGGGL